MFTTPDTPAIILAALGGGFSGRLLRLPGGTLVAATVAVALTVNLAGLSHAVPREILFIMQIFVGCMLGQSINRSFWQDFTTIWKPCLTVIFAYTVLSAPFALLLVKIYGFNSMSAVLAATPARMQDMVILAGSMQLDAVMVMLMQLCRQFAIIVLTPFMLADYRGKSANRPGPDKKRAAVFALPEFKELQENLVKYAALLVPALLGGCLGGYTGHTLGPLLAAFIFVAASRIASAKAGKAPFPKLFAFIIQCLAGVLLGVRITPQIGDLLIDRAAPLAATVVFVLVAGYAISWFLSKKFGWNTALSWMAAAPGRASDMLAISQDIELSSRDRLALTCAHTVRQVWFTLFISALTVVMGQ